MESKNVKIVNELSSHLELMEVGEKKRMTPISKEIGTHKDTITNKLTEGFILRDVLRHFKPTFQNRQLMEIEKIQPISEIGEVWKSLSQIKDIQFSILKKLP